MVDFEIAFGLTEPEIRAIFSFTLGTPYYGATTEIFFFTFSSVRKKFDPIHFSSRKNSVFW